jgi:aryl-alcohol dehydrogenase-like predicted oxidoreductase
MTEPVPDQAARPRLSAIIPPLILGTATFNHQYNDSPETLPSNAIVKLALTQPNPGFDTSPYYGPSEILLGKALKAASAPRRSYFLATKAGRIASSCFDYSPPAIRASVERSLDRLGTTYLDLVYCHDAEFVSQEEVVGAVRELRRLRDEGLIRYIGISGYPVPVLTSLAQEILDETGEPLDAVLSYSNFCVQNSTLASDENMDRFHKAGVNVVLNGSILSMGLLTTRGIDASPMAAWHPSPPELRKACNGIKCFAEEAGMTLEEVCILWAMERWLSQGAKFGTTVGMRSSASHGVTVVGVSSVDELEQTSKLWQRVLLEEGLENVHEIVRTKMWPALGKWKDFTWKSPGKDFVNQAPNK